MANKQTPKNVPPQEPWLRSAFYDMPIPALVLDPQMVVQAVNRSFLNRYTATADQVVGRRCYEVLHGAHTPCPTDRCRFHLALSGEYGHANLQEYTDAHGQAVAEEVLLSPITGPTGEITGVIETIRDVTEARRLETSLKETNEFLNRLLDSLVGVVLAADLEGHILFVNQSAKRLLGYDPQELVGKTLWSLSSHEELSRVRQAMTANGGQVLGERSFMVTKDGEHVPVRVNSSYVYRDGVPVATVGIATDLRDQIKMERHLSAARMQVVQSDKLARLGRMAAGVAHELNNPLTGITVYAELVKDSLPPDHPAQADLACIIEDAERCRDIVKGLLDYGRQSEIRVEELDLNEVVDEAFDLIRDDKVFMQIEVTKDYADYPLRFEGDAKLMRQVFINLLGNAADAMDGRGTLKVRTGIDSGGMRYAEVQDNGPGIEAADVNRVFDPFYTTKDPGRGTGLGLSVVFGVVTRHGGTVSVKETSSHGTTFLVRLPERAPEALAAFAARYHPNETWDADLNE